MALYSTSPRFENPPDGGPSAVRYPLTLGSPPYEKWILFEVKSARHILRTGMVSASGDVDRTIKSVALYLPPDALNSQLSVGWQQDDYGSAVGATIEGALQAAREAGRPVSTLGGGSVQDKLTVLGKAIGTGIAEGAKVEATKTGLEAATALFNAPQEILNKLKSAIGIGSESKSITSDQLAGAAGYMTNPRTDLFFKSVSYREHKFSFTMIPRNKQEADNIDQILNIFQFYMLPSFGTDTDTNPLFIGYPYEFEISTFSEFNGSNHHITTFDRSVLESVSISHESNGRVSFVDDEGGIEYYPSSTTLTLQFKEVRLQGRDKQKVIWRGKGSNPKSKWSGTRPSDFAGTNDPNGGSAL